MVDSWSYWIGCASHLHHVWNVILFQLRRFLYLFLRVTASLFFLPFLILM